jgi:hypothetical protein
VVKTVIELVRPKSQCNSEVEGVAAPAGMGVFFVVLPQCPVRIAQHPATNRAEDTGYGFGIVVEGVRKMVMLFVVVEVQHCFSVLKDLGELTRKMRPASLCRVEYILTYTNIPRRTPIQESKARAPPWTRQRPEAFGNPFVFNAAQRVS